MPKILIIDTETGGTNPETTSLLSVGVGVFDTETLELTEPREWLIKSDPYLVTPGALAVNKINLIEHDKKATTMYQSMSELEEYLDHNFNELRFNEDNTPDRRSGVEVAGWRVKFDLDYLWHQMYKAEDTWQSYFDARFNGAFDLRPLALGLEWAGFLPKGVGYSSNKIFKHFGINIPEEKRHTALGDVIGTAELLAKMLTMLRRLQEERGHSLSVLVNGKVVSVIGEGARSQSF